MDEYIRRGAAIEETCSDCTERNICGGSCSDTDRLRAIPAADVVEVRRGRWIHEPGHIPHCSECGRYSDDADTGEAICCPFCGAKMDGGREE